MMKLLDCMGNGNGLAVYLMDDSFWALALALAFNDTLFLLRRTTGRERGVMGG